MDLLVTIITSGIVSGVVVFLSKKFVIQFFKKDIEKFKIDLQTDHKLHVERKIHSYRKEQNKLNELWILVGSLIDNYGALEPKIEDIEDSIDKLERFVSGNEIYIHDKLFEKILLLIEKVAIRASKKDNFNEIQELRKEIVKLIRDRVIS